jgi:hypothetical protein
MNLHLDDTVCVLLSYFGQQVLKSEKKEEWITFRRLIQKTGYSFDPLFPSCYVERIVHQNEELSFHDTITFTPTSKGCYSIEQTVALSLPPGLPAELPVSTFLFVFAEIDGSILPEVLTIEKRQSKLEKLS